MPVAFIQCKWVHFCYFLGKIVIISPKNCNRTSSWIERQLWLWETRNAKRKSNSGQKPMGAESRAITAIRGWKTKLLLCFCAAFQAGNLQAGRQAQDLSDWEPSIVTHFSQPHVPDPRASAQQDGGGGSRSTNAAFQCLCASICMREDGRMSGGNAASVSLPP